MNYYNNPELAEQYGVSRRTVTNWIERARANRLDLELVRDGANHYISKSPKNQIIMKGLVQKHRKYISNQWLKSTAPKAEFYELFSDAQIIDIIYNLDKFREIPRQYNYFDHGAELWDQHTQRLYGDDVVPNMVTQTIALLDTNQGYIDQILRKHDRVNIVDVGPGNAQPVKELLTRLLAQGKLGRYIAIDISKEMLTIAERNIKEWFGGKVDFEGHVRDISHDWFADVIAELPTGEANSTVNLVLLLGAPLVNFRTPEDAMRNIANSMGSRDYLIYTTGIDSTLGRDQFYFSRTESDGKSQPLPPQYKLMVDLLGIDESHYTTEQGFSEKEHSRYLRIRLKHALTLEFKSKRGNCRLDLNKGETLLVWRARHNTAAELNDQFSECGLNPLLLSQTESHDYMLILADLWKDGR